MNSPLRAGRRRRRRRGKSSSEPKESVRGSTKGSVGNAKDSLISSKDSAGAPTAPRRRRRVWKRRCGEKAERPTGTLFMNHCVHCVDNDGVPFVRTLKDLLRTRAAVNAEVDTPCMRPAAAPAFAWDTGMGIQDAEKSGDSVYNSEENSMNGCEHGLGYSVTSPPITFTLDGVATPKTFASFKKQQQQMDVARLPNSTATQKIDPVNDPIQNQLGGDPCASDDVLSSDAEFQEVHQPEVIFSSPLRLRELPHQYLLRQFTGGECGGFEFYRTIEGKQQFAVLCRDILAQVRPVLEAESLFPQIAAPAYVFGDIHGNFEDLSFFLRNVLTFHDLQLTPANILCLGDYVDRGPYSLECLMLLLSLKVVHPAKIILLRGNHEDRVVCGDTHTYGSSCFLAQCESIFGPDEGRALFHDATDVFRHFPLAAELVIPSVPNAAVPTAAAGPSWPPPRAAAPRARRATHVERVLCTHGGIPRFSAPPRADDRLAFLRQRDFPRLLTLFPNNPAVRDDPAALAGAFAGEPTAAALQERLRRAWFVAFDLMWSDPTSSDGDGDGEEAESGGGQAEREGINEWGFGVNARGSNVLTFSSKAVNTFLQAYQYSMLFRAHQEKAHGLRLSKSSKVLTIFSTSNYLGHGNGAGCVVVAANGEIQLVEKMSK